MSDEDLLVGGVCASVSVCVRVRVCECVRDCVLRIHRYIPLAYTQDHWRHVRVDIEVYVLKFHIAKVKHDIRALLLLKERCVVCMCVHCIPIIAYAVFILTHTHTQPLKNTGAATGRTKSGGCPYCTTWRVRWVGVECVCTCDCM